jgi:hypothetical protein
MEERRRAADRSGALIINQFSSDISLLRGVLPYIHVNFTVDKHGGVFCEVSRSALPPEAHLRFRGNTSTWQVAPGIPADPRI